MSATIEVDLLCRRCGYNLRGLDDQARCPECGADVAQSTREDLLKYADPEWVRQLSRGNNLLLAGFGLVVVYVAWEIGASMAATTPGPLALVGVTLNLSASIAAALGMWLQTTPNPSVLIGDEQRSLRKWVRISVVLGLIAIPVETAQGAAAYSRQFDLLLEVIWLISSAFDVIGIFAYFTYARTLALRVPDPRLARRSRYLARALSISFTFVLLPMLYELISRLAPTVTTFPAALTLAANVFLGIVGLFLLVTCIQALIFQIRLGRALRRAAEQAQWNWSTPLRFTQ